MNPPPSTQKSGPLCWQWYVSATTKRLVSGTILLAVIGTSCKVYLDWSGWAKKSISLENFVSSQNSVALAYFEPKTHVSFSQPIQIKSLGLMQFGTTENPFHDSLYLIADSNGFQRSDVSNKLKISDGLRRKVDNELESGELIRWIDQPVPRFFTAASTKTFLFGIPWTAFFIFWMWGAGFGHMRLRDIRDIGSFSFSFPLFGIPFVLIGFWMLSSPIYTWYQAHQTVYIITDKRAISIEGGITTTIHSYLPQQLRDIYRREKDGDRGDIIIAVKLLTDGDGNQSKEEVGFMGIRNPKEIEKMLKALAKNAS